MASKRAIGLVLAVALVAGACSATSDAPPVTIERNPTVTFMYEVPSFVDMNLADAWDVANSLTINPGIRIPGVDIPDEDRPRFRDLTTADRATLESHWVREQGDMEAGDLVRWGIWGTVTLTGVRCAEPPCGVSADYQEVRQNMVVGYFTDSGVGRLFCMIQGLWPLHCYEGADPTTREEADRIAEGPPDWHCFTWYCESP